MLKIIPFFKKKSIFNSNIYWENRYKSGGNSGSGSYEHLAEFKADIINNLINEYKIHSVIEFGCGDGNQLSFIKLKSYIGLDVSISAIEICKQKHGKDKSKSFFLYNHNAFADNLGVFKMDCAISLDVLFHLVEKEIYKKYLEHLFSCASKLVIIYAANIDLPQKSKHEFYRKFTNDIESYFPEWKLDRIIKNKYPAKNYDDESGSLADFFIYIPNK